MAVLYAADNGIDVIEGADGALYHSAFMEAASQYAYEHGVAQVYSGNDLNTGNHNYPANYDHTMLIQGVAADVEGLGQDAGDARADLRRALQPAADSMPRVDGAGRHLLPRREHDAVRRPLVDRRCRARPDRPTPARRPARSRS